MAQKKCGDCKYCVRQGIAGTFCSYKRRNRCRNDYVSVNESACADFCSAEFHCIDCTYYNNIHIWCSKKSCDVERMRPACEDFFRRGDKGPNKTSDCFLTSACVEYMGKTDDCEELTLLRFFRDGYLKSTENGEELIKEYYKIAPSIVEKINASNKKQEYFSYIYEVIERCVGLIKANKNSETLAEYTSMVKKLQSEVLNGAL